MATSKFGRYVIKSEIGRGGMATVYHAFDPSSERDVAIKVLPQALLHDPQFRTRFDREAKTIALLEHPAIVPVYDVGEDNGQPYIVMRFMAGGSLADRIAQGPLAQDEITRLITRLAPALDAAHARKIIHRDLKPGNILFDQYGNAFLSDFGIARVTQESSATLTGTNILGTPTYMSPEQVQGEKNIDGRSDIYALGVLVYQMLSGEAPYSAETPAKVMMMHVMEPVPHIQLRKHDLSAGVDLVIAKAMSKNPEDRFATTGELATALEAAFRGDMSTMSFSSQGTRIVPATGLPLAGDATGSSGGQTVVVPPPIPRRVPGSKTRVWATAIPLLALACIGIAAIASLAYLGRQGKGPLAVVMARSTPTNPVQPTFTNQPATNTPAPSATVPVAPTETIAVVVAPATDIPLPADTSTPTASPATRIGGAEKVAYLIQNDVWVAGIDGSEPTRYTTDGGEKTNLQWLPDGKTIVYMSGKCAQSLDISSGRIDLITCFNFVDYFEAFEVSPDNQKVAVSLDRELYIVPFDLERLNQVRTRTDLGKMAECADFAPLKTRAIKQVHWSDDSTRIAGIVLSVLSNGNRGDSIIVFPVDQCIPNPRVLDTFPEPRFTIKGYSKNPVIQNFSWDGGFLFALTNNVRNDGYGDLYIYNMELHKATLAANPVENVCCYRDPTWSPDGSYLMFAFQSIKQGSSSQTFLYNVPYGSLGTGAAYTPLDLPPFADPREKPSPAQGGAQ